MSIRVVVLLLVFISVVHGLSLTCCSVARGQSNQLAWTNNENMVLFYEALTKIRENALEPEASGRIVEKAIRGYLREKDPFSDYLPPMEYAAYKEAQTNLYGGLGMDIWADRSGKIVCIPFPGGPAVHGGLEYGDLLIKVDGRDVSGESIYSVGTMVRGEEGTKVVLTVKKAKTGQMRSIEFVRRQISFKSVVIEQTKPLPIIRILRFTNRTVQELREVLIQMGSSRAKIIDLRGNTGGDLYAAIDVASLFLKPGQRVLGVKTNSEDNLHVIKTWPIDHRSKLFLWQDQYSASAAEVLIAALKQNGRAVSIGTKSYGKGLAQKIIELTDGSAIFITYAALTAPNGFSFNGKGLKPTYPISSHLTKSDKAYMSIVSKLLGDQEY